MFYQLDLSTASGKDRLDSRGKGERPMYSSNEGTKTTGTPTAAQSSSDGDLLTQQLLK